MLREIVSVSAENDKKKFKFFQSKRWKEEKEEEKKTPKRRWKKFGIFF